MKKRKLIIAFSLLVCLTANSQDKKELDFTTMKDSLINFLINSGDIMKFEIQGYKEGKSGLDINGLHNNVNKGKPINGIYSFSQSRTHSKAYFLIVENNDFFILDIGSRNGLDIAINTTLDFCERNKYCVDITNDYVTRLIRVYYNINVNKNPYVRYDINCERGIKDTKSLP